MPRATVIIEVGKAEDVAAMDAWFAQWESQLSVVSENLGCGCCVDILQLEGPAEAIDALPAACVSSHEWTLKP